MNGFICIHLSIELSCGRKETRSLETIMVFKDSYRLLDGIEIMAMFMIRVTKVFEKVPLLIFTRLEGIVVMCAILVFFVFVFVSADWYDE